MKLLGAFCLLGLVLSSNPIQSLPLADAPVVFETVAAAKQGDYAHWVAAVAPGGVFDRIGLHRYGRADGNGPVLLYLPGTNMNSRPINLGEEHNLLLYLANRGVTVYGLDYRTAAVPVGYEGDTRFMRDWTMARFVDDARQAFEFVHQQHPKSELYLAGFSRGVSYAYALAGQVEAAGLVALDGGFKKTVENTYDHQAALQALDESGRYASILSERRGWPGRQAMLTSVIDQPDAPASDVKFKTAGEQLAQTLYWAWGEGGLANPVDGVSDITVLAKLMLGYDRFFPAIQDVEREQLANMKDAPGLALDDQFEDISLPVLYIGATGLGSDHLLTGIYSAGKSGATATEIHVLENYGHLDVLVGKQAKVEVYDVVLRWFNQLSD